MKYLIEIPDGTVYGYDEDKKILIFPEKDFIEASEVSNLIYLPNVIPYEESIDNKFYNTAWTDGYEKGVEAGRDDAWEFVMKCLKMDGNDFYEIFGSCDALCLTNLSYQEAKVKYEAWKKRKERGGMTFEEYISELKKVIQEALDVIGDGLLKIKEVVDEMEEGEKE